MRDELFTEEQRKWWTLAAVAFGLFMIMLDNTVVNVALPTVLALAGAIVAVVTIRQAIPVAQPRELAEPVRTG